MKIAFFSEWLAIGGTERILVVLANALADRGCQVDVILLDRALGFQGQLSPAINIQYLDCRNRLRRSIFPLARYLIAKRPDIMMPMSSDWAIPAYIAKRLVCSKVSVVPAIHFGVPELGSPPTDSPAHGYLYRHVLKSVPYVVTVSRGNAAYIVEHFNVNPGRVRVINNPAVSKEMLHLAEESVDHPWFNEHRSVPVLLSVGRLSPEKDYGTLLRAFQRVLQHVEVRLVLLGDGSERNALTTMACDLRIQRSVCFAGSVLNPYKYMRNSDLLVVSSKNESFGLVLVEAMACGTPVVSSECGTGPADILENGTYGRLVPVGDADALTQAILTSLSEQPDRSRLRRRAMQFSVDAAVDEYMLLFDAAVRAGVPRTC